MASISEVEIRSWNKGGFSSKASVPLQRPDDNCPEELSFYEMNQMRISDSRQCFQILGKLARKLL